MFFEFVSMNQCQPAFLRRVINFTMLMHVYVFFSVMLFCFLYVFDIMSMFTENMFIRCTLDDTEINDKIVNLDVVGGRKFTLMYSLARLYEIETIKDNVCTKIISPCY